MKKTVTLLLAAAAFTASAQNVGVNTAAPKATLDVAGSPADAAQPDGFIAPRLTRAQLIAKTGYGADQNGAIVYVTDLSGIVNTATAAVTQPGHYVFNGTVWNAFAIKKSISAYVNAGVAVTLGNLNVRMSASGNRSLEISFTNAVAAVNGVSLNKFRTAAPPSGGDYIDRSGHNRNSTADGTNHWTAGTWRRWQAGADFPIHGASQEILINDDTNKITYRVTMIVGNAYNNNFISIEQL
ncbi:MAG: hypothetical protein KF746_23805 [Chitinophagaceae bacterium]|nr:hypothetical protein [Chitinophagaceae bacterium]